MRTKHEPVTLTAGEVALIHDLMNGIPDYEREQMSHDVRNSLPVFVPQENRMQCLDNFRRLGLIV